MSRPARSPDDIESDLKSIVERIYPSCGEKGFCVVMSQTIGQHLTDSIKPPNLDDMDQEVKTLVAAKKVVGDLKGKKFELDDDDAIAIRDEGGNIVNYELTEVGRKKADEVIDHIASQEPGSVFSCATDDHSYLIYTFDADHVYVVDADQNIMLNVKEGPTEWHKLAATGFFFDGDINEVNVANMGVCRLTEAPLVTDVAKESTDAAVRGGSCSDGTDSADTTAADRFREAVRTSATSGTATPDHGTSDDTSNAPRT